MGFFERVPAFRDFGAVLDAPYVPSPADAYVFVTDVRGSTRAIEDGRYKDVNVLGVAGILAARNAIGGPFAYVFGGDGASMLVEHEHAAKVRDALARLRHHARVRFGLELRVGAVPIADVLAEGASLEVARFEVSPHVSFAMFRGGGLVAAERLVKDEGRATGYDVPESPVDAAGEVDGLECRWNPIASRRGVMVALLVSSLRGPEVYRVVLDEVARLVEGAPPFEPGQLSLADDARAFEAESLLRGGVAGSFAHRAYRLRASALTALGRFLLRTGVSLAGFDGATYRDAVANQSDARKFDDCLRMVLDLTPAGARELEAFLAARHREGLLAYGTHAASAALMTCIVKSHADEHVHFVDGADGGYAYAAKQLKQQLAKTLT